jgi:PKD repeat protein
MRQCLLLMSVIVIVAVLTGCKPTPRYTADPTGGRADLNVTFTDNSATLLLGTISLDSLFPVTSHRWDFGDGGGSLIPNPTHTYDRQGSFTVTYTVGNVFGETTRVDTGLINVQGVAMDPTASFNWTFQDASGARQTLNFQDTSDPGSADIIEWAWDFGDGDTGNEQTPTHTYEDAGTYEVTLKVTTADGDDTATRNVTVGRIAPTADFTFAPTADVPRSFRFTDESTDGSANIDSWLWDFGDGNSSTLQNPAHTYAANGTYNVTVTVESPDGSDTSDAQVVQVLDPATASFTFEVAPTNTLRVLFTDTSTPSGPAITSWSWAFGDGASSTEQNPEHIYASGGTYTVTLRVTDSVSNVSTAQTLTVVAP